MEAYRLFFDAYSLKWILAPMGILLIIKLSLRSILWIAGPVKKRALCNLDPRQPPSRLPKPQQKRDADSPPPRTSDHRHHHLIHHPLHALREQLLLDPTAEARRPIS